MSLNLTYQSLGNGNKENILCALFKLAENDADFNGVNGEDYLWDIAKENGYDNNLDYVVSVLDKQYDNILSNTDIQNLCEDFFEMWLGHDAYYIDYQFDFIEDIRDNKFKEIILSYITEN